MRTNFKLTAILRLLALLCLMAVFFTGCGLSIDFYTDADSYQVGSGSISGTLRSLDISWKSGSVRIEAYDGEEIILTETEVSDEDDCMRFRLENGTLSVFFRDSGIHFSSPGEKDLQILIPRSQAIDLQKLEIETSDASVTVSGLGLRKLDAETASGDFTAVSCAFVTGDIETASGNILCNTCNVQNLTMDTASGTTEFIGSVYRLESTSADGDITIAATTTPTRVEAKSASGNIDLSIPADSKFTTEYESTSGEVSISGFRGTQQSNKFICGSSANKYTLETASGNICIHTK